MNIDCIAPPPLSKGDKVIITAPAGRIAPEKIEQAATFLQAAGYSVEIMPHALGAWHMFSGTDEERLSDLQQAMDDPECRMVLMARGGYGLVRIIDQLNMKDFLSHPKWVVGFSDITHLHARLQGLNFQSIHGPMAAAFANSEESGVVLLLDMAAGQRPVLRLPGHPLNRQGRARGKLVGGNLAILSSLLGSPDEPDTDGSWLFLEDVGEYLYRLDRMLHSMKRARKFDHLAGLIVGGLSEMKDGDPGMGWSAEMLFRQIVEEFDFPICMGFPAGHLPFNQPLILGANVELKVTKGEVTFSYC
ncbi:MAG: S66 peptidase family protein [Bacteroidales bacterium]